VVGLFGVGLCGVVAAASLAVGELLMRLGLARPRDILPLDSVTFCLMLLAVGATTLASRWTARRIRAELDELEATLRRMLSASESPASALESLEQPQGDHIHGLADAVGGSSLGSVLRALSASLRQDAAVRSEIAARQSWTIVSARVAVAAPWLTLAMLCTRPESAAAYRSLAGAVIVATTAGLSVLAYLLMLRIARLPQMASA
jgi:tight adherence protein B